MQRVYLPSPVNLLFFLSVWIIAVSCGPPRCKIPTCYVRMLHRHGGAGFQVARVGSTASQDRGASQGKVYRGVPWWKKNKNPKIADGYKPGYKYDYRKGKYRPPKDKRKKGRGEEPAVAEGGEEPVTEGEEATEGEVTEEQPPEGQVTEEAAQPEKKKGLFKKSRKKKEKKTKAEPEIEEKEPEEEKEGF